MPSVPDLSFVDIRYWTTAWECTRHGIEVVPRNLCDPHGMRLNDHPRIWLAPAFLGLGEGSTFVLGLLVGGAFLLAVFATSGGSGCARRSLYAALLCSPSVMLGIERANTDLIVFVVVAAGVLIAGRGTRLAAAIGSALLLFAAVLKLYPALAWGALLRLPRRLAVASLLVAWAAFAVYLLATLDDLRAMREHFPRELQFSYGAPVLAQGGTALAGARAPARRRRGSPRSPPASSCLRSAARRKTSAPGTKPRCSLREPGSTSGATPWRPTSTTG